MPVFEDFGFGQRLDGTNKGPGFAAIHWPDGSISTEISMGPNGEYPLIYNGITPWDLQTINDAMQFTPRSGMWPILPDPRMEVVYDNAYEAYLNRLAQGTTPYWQSNDGYPGMNYIRGSR